MSTEEIKRGPGRPSPSQADKEADAAECQRIIEENGESLQRWLGSVGLTIADARPVQWSKLMSQWKSRNVFEAAQIWLRQEKTALVSVWEVTPRVLVAGRIARAFAEIKFANLAPQPVERLGVRKELEILPDTLRWVYLHPKLSPATSELEKAALEMYEKQHPCPDQGARNRLNHCLIGEKAEEYREKFFAKVDGFLMEEKKRMNKKPDGGAAAKTSDDPELADLESEILKMKKKPA